MKNFENIFRPLPSRITLLAEPVVSASFNRHSLHILYSCTYSEVLLPRTPTIPVFMYLPIDYSIILCTKFSISQRIFFVRVLISKLDNCRVKIKTSRLLKYIVCSWHNRMGHELFVILNKPLKHNERCVWTTSHKPFRFPSGYWIQNSSLSLNFKINSKWSMLITSVHA